VGPIGGKRTCGADPFEAACAVGAWLFILTTGGHRALAFFGQIMGVSSVGRTRTSLRVLLVDDSSELLERLVEMLSHIEGLEVVGQLKSVSEVRTKLPDLHPDVVILDLQLSDGNGIEILHELRESNPDTQVIVFTNQPEEQYRRKCAELGVEHFLSKSTDSSLLVKIAEQIAENPEARTQAHSPQPMSLSKVEERYRDFFENAKDAIFVHDLSGRYTMVNKAGEALIGYTRDELLRMTIFDVVPLLHLHQIQSRLKKKLADHVATVYEVEVIRKDGTRVPVEVSSRLIYENGVAVAVQGTARDISERWQTLQALRESEERFRNLFENAKDTVFTCDLEGNFTSINPAGERLTEYSVEEMLKSDFSLVVAPEYVKSVQEMVVAKAGGDVATIYELEIITKSGQRVWVEISSRTIHSQGKPVGVQGIARDISERKRAEEARHASQLRLQQSQKLEAIGELAGGVAHDFNNLLTAIIGYTDLSLKRAGLENSIHGNLEETRKAAERAAALIRQLLAFSRKQILEPKVLDLNLVVQDMHKMLKRLIGENIDLATRPAENLGRVKADPSQVEQIIMNLVVNARDAMPRGGKVMIETANAKLDNHNALKHVSIKTGEYVMLAVTDTGSGMDRETQARIFEPFFTTKEIGKGTGLGLSTVYGIVKQSGGNIWVYSEPGMGTVFKVYLPRIDAAAITVEKMEQEALAPLGSETILLVEDEDTVRGLTRKVLMQAGYKVLDAKGGDEALRLCRAHTGSIDLLLTDVVMPGISGKEVADRLSKLRPTTRVLFMSGYTDEAIVQHGVLDANVQFLQKPFTWSGLAKKVRDVLDRNIISNSSESPQA
jgi:two-component system, cell cycle sensor histidine kinase and response regulator CckA